jgi:hypothetical protein
MAKWSTVPMYASAHTAASGSARRRDRTRREGSEWRERLTVIGIPALNATRL